MVNKQSYNKWDNKLSLYLVIFTHIQFVVGLILYFVSPRVKFGAETMSVDDTRYWTVEHIFGMLIAVALITVARASTKRMANDLAKHKRMFTFSLVALIIIITTVALSGRGVLGSTVM